MARILIVDDEEPIRRVVRAVVERLGHTAEEAENGVEGLSSFQQRPQDLVITDVLMPHMGGLRFVSELKAVSPDQKVIAISGGGAEGKLNFLATMKTFPNVQILRKPFRPQELMEMISGFLAQ